MASVIRGSGASTLGGALDVQGVLTYEDVTSVDSVGIITARSGINVGTGASIFSPDTNELALGTNNVERLHIASGGLVGIGTDTPGSPLEVNGGSGLDVATFNSHHADGPLINVQRSGTSIGFVGSGKNLHSTTGSVDALALRSQAEFTIATGGATERLRITSDGDILPGGNRTQDLGSSSNSFANVYAGNIELSDDYPAIKPSLSLNFAGARALDPRITFTRNSVGTYVGRDGLIKTANANEPRFDHDPVTLESLGLLLEEERTNYNGNSGSDTNIGRFGNGPGSTSNTTAPNGENTAIIPVPDANADRFEAQLPNAVFSTGEVWTFSWFEKNIAFSGTEPIVDVSGHVNLSSVSNPVVIGTYPNGWKRWSVTATITDGSVDARFRYYFGDEIGVGNDNVAAFWGHQAEKGSFATSYIRGNGVSVTRGADVANILGENFSNTFNTFEGTFIAECDRGNDGTEGAGIGAMRRSASQYHNMIQFGEFYDNAGMVGRIFVGGTGTKSVDTSNHVTGQGVYNRYGFSYSATTVAGTLNGVLQGTSGTQTGALPTELDRFVFGGYADDRDVNSLDGHIKYLYYYSKRLTDAQLQLLTS